MDISRDEMDKLAINKSAVGSTLTLAKPSTIRRESGFGQCAWGGRGQLALVCTVDLSDNDAVRVSTDEPPAASSEQCSLFWSCRLVVLLSSTTLLSQNSSSIAKDVHLPSRSWFGSLTTACGQRSGG